MKIKSLYVIMQAFSKRANYVYFMARVIDDYRLNS